MSGCLFLSLRVVASTPWEVLRDEEANAPKATLGCGGGDRVEEGNPMDEWRFLCSLVRHESALPAEERLQVAVRAAAIVKSLNHTGFFPERGLEGNKEDEVLLLTRLYDTQFRVAHNVHTVYSPAGEVSGDIPLAAVGTAVYRAAVLLNHSCCQNTAKFFADRGKIVMLAKRGIAQGEEVTNTYGPHHSRDPREERRTRLLADYKFDCDCLACRGDYPLLRTMQSSSSSPVKKGLTRQLDKLLCAYRRAFSAGDYRSALSACQEYLRRLDSEVAAGGVTFPNVKYGYGEVALDSCWWAIMRIDQQG